MTRTALFLCLALATPAHALSCLRPDAVRLYDRAVESTDAFYIVKGRLTGLDAVTAPTQKQGEQKKDIETRTTVRLTGTALGPNGFNTAFDRDITLRLECISVWCAGAPSGEDHLLAIQLKGTDALELSVGPCGGNAVLWDQNQENRLLACHKGDTCETSDGVRP